MSEFNSTNSCSTAYLVSLGAGGLDFPFPEIWMSEFEKNRIPDGTETNKHASEAVRRSCKIVMIMAFEEVEGKYLDHLSSVLGGKKMVPVGPIVREPEPGQGFENLTTWLDEKAAVSQLEHSGTREGNGEGVGRSTPTSSTVFMSFGIEYYPTKEEIEEIAMGLELSLVNFIWVVRLPKTGEKQSIKSMLPNGFIERIGKRGMVIEGWAPQARILAHPSIGGFMSHCGWISVLESMRFGVPIVVMPIQTDQPLNARLVTSIGAGFEVERGGCGEYKRDEICRVIRKVAVEEDGVGVRRKARELSQVNVEKGEVHVDVVAKELARICKEYARLSSYFRFGLSDMHGKLRTCRLLVLNLLNDVRGRSVLRLVSK